MAINLITLSWLSRLAQNGQLRGGSVLDLGPQDLLFCPRRAVEACARRHGAGHLIDEIFDGETFRRSGGSSALYRTFGYDRHRSSDPFDPRADWTVDLNSPPALPDGRYVRDSAVP